MIQVLTEQVSSLVQQISALVKLLVVLPQQLAKQPVLDQLSISSQHGPTEKETPILSMASKPKQDTK